MTVRAGVAMITGASTALGAAFARELATRCEQLLLVTKQPDTIQALVRELEQQTPITVLSADLAVRIDSGRLVDIIRQRGPLACLVNIAETDSDGEVLCQRPDQQESLLDACVRGSLAVTRSALAGMRANGRGLIVNVVFAPALQPQAGAATFGATQAFLAHYSLALRREVAAAGIDVRCLYAGFFTRGPQDQCVANYPRLAAMALAADGTGWMAAAGTPEPVLAGALRCDHLQSA